jgi:hypothetical protein
VRGQLQYTCSLRLQWRDSKCGKVFDEVNDAKVIIEINQVDRKQHAQRMNTAGRDHPDAFIKSEPESSDQSFESSEGRIGRRDTQAQKALAGVVVCAICPSFQVVSLPSESKRRTSKSPCIGRPSCDESD